MELTSPAFENDDQIPSRYTCDGEGVRPTLEISGTPPHTHCFALIVDDLDANDGNQNFLHWVVWNIPPRTTVMPADNLPGAVEGKTSFGTYHWGAPCPPKGVHRYRFRLFALDTGLSLPREVSAEDLEEEMNGHVLAQAELMGTYQRH